MPKKQKKAKAKYARPSRVTRKKAIARVIATLVENSDDHEKFDVIEQLITSSLGELGKHLSVDMSGAIILSGDDPGALLQHAIMAHHVRTKIPLEDLYDQLMEQLTAPLALAN